MTDERIDGLLRGAMRGAPKPELRGSFERDVLHRARQQREARRLSASGRRWMFAYVAAALAMSVLIVLRIDWSAVPVIAIAVAAPVSFLATLAAPEVYRRLAGGDPT